MSNTRTVLTTGANSGLGLATVIEMAKRGYTSVGTVRSAGKAKVVQKAAAEAGVDVETERLDVTDVDECAAVIAAVRPDVLVNNAGYMLYAAIEEENTRAMFTRMEPFLTEASTVARVIAKAAATRSPQPRYPVGLDARMTTLTDPLVPQTLRDFVLRRSSGL